jgi:hypothetical protein
MCRTRLARALALFAFGAAVIAVPTARAQDPGIGIEGTGIDSFEKAAERRAGGYHPADESLPSLPAFEVPFDHPWMHVEERNRYAAWTFSGTPNWWDEVDWGFRLLFPEYCEPESHFGDYDGSTPAPWIDPEGQLRPIAGPLRKRAEQTAQRQTPSFTECSCRPDDLPPMFAPVAPEWFFDTSLKRFSCVDHVGPKDQLPHFPLQAICGHWRCCPTCGYVLPLEYDQTFEGSVAEAVAAAMLRGAPAARYPSSAAATDSGERTTPPLPERHDLAKERPALRNVWSELECCRLVALHLAVPIDSECRCEETMSRPLFAPIAPRWSVDPWRMGVFDGNGPAWPHTCWCIAPYGHWRCCPTCGEMLPLAADSVPGEFVLCAMGDEDGPEAIVPRTPAAATKNELEPTEAETIPTPDEHAPEVQEILRLRQNVGGDVLVGTLFGEEGTAGDTPPEAMRQALCRVAALCAAEDDLPVRCDLACDRACGEAAGCCNEHCGGCVDREVELAGYDDEPVAHLADEETIHTLRATARDLDVSAAALEERELYDRADELRFMAQALREDARALSAGGASSDNQASTRHLPGTVWLRPESSMIELRAVPAEATTVDDCPLHDCPGGVCPAMDESPGELAPEAQELIREELRRARAAQVPETVPAIRR